MEKSRKLKIMLVILLVILVVGLSVGYAALSAQLKINGTATATGGSWDIYFDNASVLKEIEYGKSNKLEIIENNKKLNFEFSLTAPKDKIIYQVDIVNNSTVDATIENINVALPTEIQNIVEVKTYYASDGKEIKESDVIAKRQDSNTPTKETINISIYYKYDISNEDLPENDLENLKIGYEITYTQYLSKDEEISNIHNGQVIPREELYYNTSYIPDSDLFSTFYFIKQKKENNLVSGKCFGFIENDNSFMITSYTYDVQTGIINISDNNLNLSYDAFSFIYNVGDLIVNYEYSGINLNSTYQGIKKYSDKYNFYFGIYYNKKLNLYICITPYGDDKFVYNIEQEGSRGLTTGESGLNASGITIGSDGKSIIYNDEIYTLVESF